MPQVSDWFGPATTTAPPRVWLLAELGVNHDGSVDRALELTRAAKSAGADAIKLQRFEPDRLLSNQALLADYQTGKADDAAALLRSLVLSVDEMRIIRDAARAAGLKFVVTPFSLADVADLASLEVDAVKIASPDAVNLPLLRESANLGVPMLVSTGTCELAELTATVELLRTHSAGGCIMQCVSSYPTPTDAAALGGIAALATQFGDIPVGYSDHTPDTHTGALAVASGAVVLEKHVTYDRAAVGPDHAVSLEPDTFAEYVRLARQAATMTGPRCKAVLSIENDVRQVSRQSLCATRDLPADHVLTREDLTIKRPGTGLPAAVLMETIGRRLARPVRANDLLLADDLA
ncbi:N-acetylneuraminate synthase family protein [Phycisphaerales bacterium AB-hyl4]|uniref:N-acetylneuraminate synthase family protein n=1 Tax=Natronomicrosphaera hydrolytica TaxID=3242702 RepID=A0ABV4U622_9BACT